MSALYYRLCKKRRKLLYILLLYQLLELVRVIDVRIE